MIEDNRAEHTPNGDGSVNVDGVQDLIEAGLPADAGLPYEGTPSTGSTICQKLRALTEIGMGVAMSGPLDRPALPEGLPYPIRSAVDLVQAFLFPDGLPFGIGGRPECLIGDTEVDEWLEATDVAFVNRTHAPGCAEALSELGRLLSGGGCCVVARDPDDEDVLILIGANVRTPAAMAKAWTEAGA